MTEKKTLRSFIALFVVLALIFVSAIVPAPIVQAETVQIGYVNGESVYVRTGPGRSYAPVDQLSYVQVEITGSAQGADGYEWKKIRYESIEGYIRGDFVTVLSMGTGTDKSFEDQLAAFPESYREALKTLHAIYPNWTFEADNLPDSFDTALDAEDAVLGKDPLKLVKKSDAISWRSMGNLGYDWNSQSWITTSGGGWIRASKEVIAYYMDPRNFLTANDIFMFMTLTYDRTTQTADGVKDIVKNTFLEKVFSDTSDYNGSYIDIIMAAAEQTGISPYMLASTIIQEQGVNGTSSLISGTYNGYVGYYNFLNFGASGTTETDVIVNGLKYAKNMGWNSRSKAIIGGASQLAGNYFSQGQNTYYYKNFDVRTGRYNHQYAQNIYDSKSSSASLRSLYIGDTSSKLHFLIPVYKDMWDTPAPKPAENDKKNNYYFTSLGVSGFSMYTEQYSISVSGDKNISYSVPSGASYIGPTSVSLKKGTNTVKLTVKAETGATNVYTLTVNASNACTLTIGSGTTPTPPTSVKKGDANNDGNINAVDSALIRLHILKRKTLTGDALKGADVNGDGNINAIDSALVRLHILGRKTIEQ